MSMGKTMVEIWLRLENCVDTYLVPTYSASIIIVMHCRPKNEMTQPLAKGCQGQGSGSVLRCFLSKFWDEISGSLYNECQTRVKEVEDECLEPT